jgi:DUF4097 and DUF4098 domain-containing protein YvlB
MHKFQVSLIVALVMVATVLVAAGQAQQQWDFSDVTKIKFEGISGDVIIEQGEGEIGSVEVDADVNPRRNFRPEVEQDGRMLYIEERWRGHSSRGDVRWTIVVPQTEKPLRINMSTASGDCTCRGAINARLRFNTASGDIELTAVSLAEGSTFSTASGNIELAEMEISEGTEFSTASGDVILEDLTIGEDCVFSTASGDVTAEECRGEFELSTASGDVRVRDCDLSGWCTFSSASGDVDVSLEALPDRGLKASTASGRVTLDCTEFGDDFTLVMVKRENRGRISCPFDYTSEDYYEEWDHLWEEKIVERGSGKPEIILTAATGSIIVRD